MPCRSPTKKLILRFPSLPPEEHDLPMTQIWLREGNEDDVSSRIERERSHYEEAVFIDAEYVNVTSHVRTYRKRSACRKRCRGVACG